MRTDTILVIPYADGIGDFVNIQPLLAALRRRFPEAEFTVAASEHGNFLINDPAIEVATPSGLSYEPGRLAVALRPLLPQRLLAWVAGPLFDRELGPFDLVINFFYAWERGMDFRTYWTPQVPPLPGAVHTLDFLADELERELELVITPEQRKPRLMVRPSASKWASRFWVEHDLEGTKVVGLVPSTNMRIKRWPLRNWVRLDAHLREWGCRTLLFCNEPDGHLQHAFMQAGSEAIPVCTTLDNVAGLLARCDLVVGVDTGLLHMAGAVGARWVGLFGPTNPDVTGPYDRSGGVALVAPFVKRPTCAGCWKHFKYESDKCLTFPESLPGTPASCMSYLKEDEVLAACHSMLEPENPIGLAAPSYRMPYAHQAQSIMQ
jgi:ADP-heptose:LPS heptosyltransferase